MAFELAMKVSLDIQDRLEKDLKRKQIFYSKSLEKMICIDFIHRGIESSFLSIKSLTNIGKKELRKLKSSDKGNSKIEDVDTGVNSF